MRLILLMLMLVIAISAIREPERTAAKLGNFIAIFKATSGQCPSNAAHTE